MHFYPPEPSSEVNPPSGRRRGFTLIELLVVIVIIGLLATIGLPAIKGMTKSNGIIAANRQLLDDLAYARQRAIADHTTVYVVFVPPTIGNVGVPNNAEASTRKVYTNLLEGQFTTYALISLRSVGDQPGQNSPRYLTAWRTLPAGIFIRTNKFDTYSANLSIAETNRAFPSSKNVFFPFPVVSTNSTSVGNLPYIGFDYQGQLISTNQENEAIPLERGSIFYPRDGKGNVIAGTADVLENPPGNSTNIPNIIYIDWLTGRARVIRPEVQ